MSHASIPASVREARGLTEDLIRLSVSKLFQTLDIEKEKKFILLDLKYFYLPGRH